MKNQLEKQIDTEETQVDVIKLDLYELDSYKEAKATQESLALENPFLSITDNKTNEDAKKRRTALVKGRTSLEGQQKAIFKNLNNLKTYVGEETKKLIGITLPLEESQQIEVKRYEAVIEAKRKEVDELEKKRVKDINDLIETFKADSRLAIDEATFKTIDKVVGDIETFSFDAQEFACNLMQIKNSLLLDAERRAKFLLAERDMSIELAKMDLARDRAKSLLCFECVSNEDLANISDEKFTKIRSEAYEVYEKSQSLKSAEQEKFNAEQKKLSDDRAEFQRKQDIVTQEENRKLAIEKDKADTAEKERLSLEKVEHDRIALEQENERKERLKPDYDKMVESFNSLSLPNLDLVNNDYQEYYKNVQNALNNWKQTLIQNIK